MNTNPIEVSESTSKNLLGPDELPLVWFLIANKPPHKLTLRTQRIAIDEFRKLSPIARGEIIECLDRLFGRFKIMLGETP